MARVVITEDLCKSCELCIQVCPKKILKTSDKLNVNGFHPSECIDMSQCIGCSMCALTCPDVAIEVYK